MTWNSRAWLAGWLSHSGGPANENVFASSKRVTVQVLRGKESCCPNEHTAGSSCVAETVGALFSPQDGGDRAREGERWSYGFIYVCKHTHTHVLYTAYQARCPICFASGPTTHGLACSEEDGWWAEQGGGNEEKINGTPMKRLCPSVTLYQYVTLWVK